MGWTKGQLVDQAYAELALQGYDFDISPEEEQSALIRLDAMMADWEQDGIQIGYAFADSPDGIDADTDSGIPPSANQTVFLSLAMQMAASIGKQLAPTTMRTQREGYGKLLRKAAFPPSQQFQGVMPVGAGNRRFYGDSRPFFPSPDLGPLSIDSGGDLNISPE